MNRMKPKFPCKICKGYHLTHMCPTIPEVQRVWSLYQGSFSLEPPLVSQQPIQPLVDEVVEPMQYLVNPTLLLEGDVSTDHVFFTANS
jgi:hypothetical protein